MDKRPVKKKKHETPKFKNYTICKVCNVIYFNGKWVFDAKLLKNIQKKNLITDEIVCIACKRVQENKPGGLVIIDEMVLKERYEEIKNLINNVEKKGSPFDRLIGIINQDIQIIFTFTTSEFAVSIAKRVARLLHCKLDYHWKDDNDSVSVYIQAKL